MPKNLKQALLTAFLVIPLGAFAHGEEVLFVPLITVILTIIFTLTMLILKPSFSCKLPLSLVYVVSTVITYALTNLFPFRENMTVIFLITACIPVIMVVIAYRIIKKIRSDKV